jgi:hypothetical protein
MDNFSYASTPHYSQRGTSLIKSMDNFSYASTIYEYTLNSDGSVSKSRAGELSVILIEYSVDFVHPFQENVELAPQTRQHSFLPSILFPID